MGRNDDGNTVRMMEIEMDVSENNVKLSQTGMKVIGHEVKVTGMQ